MPHQVRPGQQDVGRVNMDHNNSCGTAAWRGTTSDASDHCGGDSGTPVAFASSQFGLVDFKLATT